LGLVNDEFLLCSELEPEENIVRSFAEADFFSPDVYLRLDIP